MKWALENALPAGFVLVVAALCAAGFASYLSTQEFAEAGKTVAQSQEILRELESTLLAVKEMESRQLTVLASGSEMIPPSPAEVSAISIKLGRLKELASGLDGRLERVQELERYVAREAELLQQISDSRESAPDQPPRSKRAGERFLPSQAKFGRPQQLSLGPRLKLQAAFGDSQDQGPPVIHHFSSPGIAYRGLYWPGLLPPLSPYAGEASCNGTTTPQRGAIPAAGRLLSGLDRAAGSQRQSHLRLTLPRDGARL